MPIAEAFSELDATVGALLKDLPAINAQCLRNSRARLATRHAILPSLMTINQLGFDWRCQTQFNGKDTRFLFFRSLSSAREMLDARMNLRVRPWPPDAALPAPPPHHDSVRVRLPERIAYDLPDAEFQRIAPVGAQRNRTLVLRPGSRSTFAVWAGPQDEIKAEYLRARWVRPNVIIDCGPKKRSAADPRDIPLAEIWPVELFLVMAQALAADNAGRMTGDELSFASLRQEHEIWQLAAAALDLGRGVALYGASQATNDPDSLSWGVSDLRLAVGALVKPAAEDEIFARLAKADDPDTFVSPFQIGWEPGEPLPQLRLSLSIPDVVATGVVRDLLLEQFASDDLLDQVEDLARENFPAEPARQARSWLSANLARGTLLRVDRTGKRDSFIFLLAGEIAGVSCAFFLSAEDVVLKVEAGGLVVKDRVLQVSYVGPASGEWLPWKNGFGSRTAQSQLLCDALAILLRWRMLLP